MCNPGNIKPDTFISTKPTEVTFGEVRAIICDDAMGVTVSQDYILEECDSSTPIQLADWLHFDPLGEFIHHDEDVRHVPSGRPEGSHHVQTPDGKQPSERNSLQL